MDHESVYICEERWITIGRCLSQNTLVVIHTYHVTRKNNEFMRIIIKKEYDFSKGVRGKFYRPKKIQKTIRLDKDQIVVTA